MGTQDIEKSRKTGKIIGILRKGDQLYTKTRRRGFAASFKNSINKSLSKKTDYDCRIFNFFENQPKTSKICPLQFSVFSFIIMFGWGKVAQKTCQVVKSGELSTLSTEFSTNQDEIIPVFHLFELKTRMMWVSNPPNKPKTDPIEAGCSKDYGEIGSEL